MNYKEERFGYCVGGPLDGVGHANYVGGSTLWAFSNGCAVIYEWIEGGIWLYRGPVSRAAA